MPQFISQLSSALISSIENTPLGMDCIDCRRRRRRGGHGSASENDGGRMMARSAAAVVLHSACAWVVKVEVAEKPSAEGKHVSCRCVLVAAAPRLRDITGRAVLFIMVKNI